jgi:hypothetical protein
MLVGDTLGEQQFTQQRGFWKEAHACGRAGRSRCTVDWA